MKQTLRRRAYVLTEDVMCGDAPDKHLRKLQVIAKGTAIVRESGSGEDNHDKLYVYDDDANPVSAIWPHQPLFARIEKRLKRAQTSCAKILYEYNVYDPQAVALILSKIVDEGRVSHEEFREIVKQFREEYQSDVVDDRKTEIEEEDD